MKTAAILIARLIFAFAFAQGAAFKLVFFGMDATAGQIAAAGFPYPLLLAWVAAFFEIALAIAFLTGSISGRPQWFRSPTCCSWASRSMAPTGGPET